MYSVKSTWTFCKSVAIIYRRCNILYFRYYCADGSSRSDEEPFRVKIHSTCFCPYPGSAVEELTWLQCRNIYIWIKPNISNMTIQQYVRVRKTHHAQCMSQTEKYSSPVVSSVYINFSSNKVSVSMGISLWHPITNGGLQGKLTVYTLISLANCFNF